MSTATTITLTWDEINCVDRNGVITGYMVHYGITTFNTSLNVTGTSASDRTFTASGLVPLTTYMFRIAAVNSDGVGPYSGPNSFNTSFPRGKQAYITIVVLFFYTYAEVSLKFNNKLLHNQSIVDLEDITTGDGRLFCLTNSSSCCRSTDTRGVGVGEWFFPNGTSVPPRDSLLTRERGTSFVALSRRTTSNVATGLFRCEIPGGNRKIVIIAGVYRSDEGLV